jgi:hypothetical protein
MQPPSRRPAGPAALSRRQLLTRGAAGLLALVAAPTAWARRSATLLSSLQVSTQNPFRGDRLRFATVGIERGRRGALLRFRLDRRAAVTLEVMETGQGVASERNVGAGEANLYGQTATYDPGDQTLAWTPPRSLPARTYILRLTADDGRTTKSENAVVRVLGVDAAFVAPSCLPGSVQELVIQTDARHLSLVILRCGPETVPTYANNLLNGIPVTAGRPLDWMTQRNAPAAVYVPIGNWPSGIYTARLQASDGRLGFAPVVVAPAAPTHRVAVITPALTWQAYNFYDADGDGWGDTWYSRWATSTVDLRRPHANRGVPYRFRSYELAFHHWLAQRGIDVDVYADVDLERFTSPDQLRAAYDLLVFPGHTEYVTTAIYDLVSGFRDRGGNLMFLSANNFFRRVDRDAHDVRLIDEWRNLGRPESDLCGVQYIASDRGQRHGPFVVSGADQAPWAFAGTGLQNGSTFGSYGIEIDARAPQSPPNTTVLASIPNLFGPGRTGEMTYYEHTSGARVFSAGALNFGGQVLLWPQTTQLLDNIWQRLTTG